MAATDSSHLMQCPCGLRGNGVEVENDRGTQTFRDRVFHITSGDHPDTVHVARFQWLEANRRSTGECRGEV